jgi:hypothetical protein
MWLCGHSIQHYSTNVTEGAETTKPAFPIEQEGGFIRVGAGK